jgi:UDP-N-acetylmuramoyl-tripeptide--D-alanyl-D-alanine ligase
MRMEILQIVGVTIINDSYNSNPKSMESAIHVLSSFNTKGRRVLVSGDMLELGAVSNYFHHQLGINVAESGIDIFIGVGSLSQEAAASSVRAGMNKDAVWFCKDSKEAGELLLKILHTGDVVLIKGSRAMNMEKACSTIYSIR